MNKLKIAGWNIEGFLSKLEFAELIDYLSSFDIFALFETWTIEEKDVVNLFEDFKCFFNPAEKHKKYG